MEILHVSAECYPMAKAGGLADVVGALPAWQHKAGHFAKVVTPMHRTAFLYDNDWEVVHKGGLSLGGWQGEYTIIKEKTNKLGFDLYCVDIFGLLDRERIYGYDDDTDRFLAFQVAVTDWLSKWNHRPDVVHVHDHHAALIPFMMRHCIAFSHLASIPTVLTIHNAQYQGWMSWQKAGYLPAWDTWRWGLLDWNDSVNSLACGIKCADRVTTVSEGYLRELFYDANGLEKLITMEQSKCLGLINGIDHDVWDPLTDAYLTYHFSEKDADKGKQLNKESLCQEFGIDAGKPLFVFIGRLVTDKGADLLPSFISLAVEKFGIGFGFLILGSGEKNIEDLFRRMPEYKNVHVQFGYNEKLSHRMYAGGDFLFMPSRVEPCGLNQMYAMRYGTVPVTRNTGGLKDTVKDIGESDGFGITFNQAALEDMLQAMERCVALYADAAEFRRVRKLIMNIDNSWVQRAGKYVKLYSSIQNQHV